MPAEAAAEALGREERALGSRGPVGSEPCPCIPLPSQKLIVWSNRHPLGRGRPQYLSR